MRCHGAERSGELCGNKEACGRVRRPATLGTSFFGRGDAGSLADAIEEAFADAAPGVDVEAGDQAIAAAGERAAAAGAAFVGLVTEAVERQGAGRRKVAGP